MNFFDVGDVGENFVALSYLVDSFSWFIWLLWLMYVTHCVFVFLEFQAASNRFLTKIAESEAFKFSRGDRHQSYRFKNLKFRRLFSGVCIVKFE